MTKIKQYTSATGFRRALEERLGQIAKTEGAEIQNLRRQVSFDRFLTRLFAEEPAPWILKGGYAMQLRNVNARSTKDIDLAVKEGRLFSEDKKEQINAIHEVLQERTKLDLGDFFEFIVTGPVRDLSAAPEGGARFHVEARMDGRSFEKFQLDIGVGDVWIDPVEKLSSRSWLEFAGIKGQVFPAISKEQQFAKKLYAYTLPRGDTWSLDPSNQSVCLLSGALRENQNTYDHECK